jgi:hypothetical protein
LSYAVNFFSPLTPSTPNVEDVSSQSASEDEFQVVSLQQKRISSEPPCTPSKKPRYAMSESVTSGRAKKRWKVLRRHVSSLFKGAHPSACCMQPKYWTEQESVGTSKLRLHFYPSKAWKAEWESGKIEKISYKEFVLQKIRTRGVRLEKQNVIYFSDEDLRQYRTKAQAGLLYRRRTTLKAKNYIFILSSNNRLYVGTKKQTLFGRVQHSSFSGGTCVKSAGWMRFNVEGKLVEIANFSGHYRPKAVQVFNIIRHLQRENVDLRNVQLAYSPTGSPENFSKLSIREWLESQGAQLNSHSFV